MKQLSIVLLLSLFCAGCYQASMTTGLEPGDTVVEKKWASSFLSGLVAAEVDVSDECPHGIASAEREISFANGLVTQLLLGIYSPQTVRVTCAAAPSASASVFAPQPDFALPPSATSEEVRETLAAAAQAAAESAEPVHVHVTTAP